LFGQSERCGEIKVRGDNSERGIYVLFKR